MTNKLSTRFNRAKDIYQQEGFVTLIMRVIRFLLSQCTVYFQYGNYYLYERKIKQRNETDFLPRIHNFTFKVVTSKEQADELSVEGLDLPEYITRARYRLEKGAIALCTFIEGELAYIGWVAMTEEAKNAINPGPYHVDFLNKEAWTGGGWANPKYRRLGLMTYSMYKEDEFLREKGVKKGRSVVLVTNIASNRANSKYGSRVYAKGRYLKILWWKSRKETPIKSIENNNDK